MKETEKWPSSYKQDLHAIISTSRLNKAGAQPSNKTTEGKESKLRQLK